MAMNQLQYSEIETKLTRIQELTTEIEKAVNEMDALVKENVNNESVWKGTSSSAFITKWEEFSATFPNFVSAFRKQGVNVANILTGLQAAEE